MSPGDLLPFGDVGEGVVTAIAAVAAFIVVCAVWQALLTPDPMAVRAKRLSRQRHQMLSARSTPRGQSSRRKANTLMRSALERLDLLRSRTTEKTAERLACAGWRSPDAVVTFLVAKLLGPFLFGASAFVLVTLLHAVPLPQPLDSFSPVLAVGLGFCAPDLFLRNAVEKRQKAIQKGLPDALDLLVICAEAGLSLDAALNRVATEMQQTCVPLADELALTGIELGFLPERRQALQNLSKRCPMQSVSAVVNTLLQTERYGTPLARALRVLSGEFRNERMMKAEEKAARLPAILTVPMILLILPALFIVLAGPAALRVIDSMKSL